LLSTRNRGDSTAGTTSAVVVAVAIVVHITEVGRAGRIRGIFQNKP